MRNTDEEFVVINLEPNFPLDDVQRISEFLKNSGCLIPGYIPPKVGLLDLHAIWHVQKVEQWNILVLPDRNLVSSIAKVAQHGLKNNIDQTTKIAVNLMAFCQCLNIDFEPSVAFHEVAIHSGNTNTLEELGWFRAADEANPLAWIDLALKHSTDPIAIEAKPVKEMDLAFPLHRWKRNYVIALKIADLELNPSLEADEKLYSLVKWMKDSFIVGGPAMLLAAIYFAPKVKRRGMFKRLRSDNRERALQGIRNEAWDITHLSDFVKRVSESETTKTRLIFATADKQLARLAPLLLPHGEDTKSIEHEFSQNLQEFWPQKIAEGIASNIVEAFEFARKRELTSIGNDEIEQLTKLGEECILSYSPSPCESSSKIP